MKMKTLLVLLPLVVATPTSATDKYVSTEFGFAVSFPAQVISSQIRPDVFLFKAPAPGSAWASSGESTPKCHDAA
jgi:hypothetical protein